jgi:IrrE N-terminal-like domain
LKRWRRNEIRSVALAKILTPLWRRRREFGSGAALSPLALLPIRPNEIITELLRLRIEEPEEIILDFERDPDTPSLVGGIVDRELGRFVIAGRFPLASRRFTTAHELGHYFLHPDLVYHRDIPLIGTEYTEIRGRLPEEVEADLFAAEVLMPSRLLRDLFVARYRGAISPDEIDEGIAFKLSMGASRTLTIDMLVHGGPRYRSRIIATDTHAGPSFVELFLVSREAMAIRLEQLDLVL